MQETFTDADVFGVEFTDPRLPPELRTLVLLGTFLVDITCFDRKSMAGLTDAVDWVTDFWT